MRATLVLAVALGSSPMALAQRPADAEAHYLEGQAAYRAGRYDDAAEAFRAAWELTEAPALLHNMARSLENAGRLDEARDAIRQLLALAGLNRDLRQRGADDLERVLDALRERDATEDRIRREGALRARAAAATTDAEQVGVEALLDQVRIERRAHAERLAARETRRREAVARLRSSLAEATRAGDTDEIGRLEAALAAHHTAWQVRLDRLAAEVERADRALAEADDPGEQARLRARRDEARLARSVLLAGEAPAPPAQDVAPVQPAQPVQPDGERPPSSLGVAGWSAVGVGGAATIAGAVLLIHADSVRRELEGGLAATDEHGVVTGIGQERALRLEAAADAQDLAGLVTLSVGVAVAAAGAVLLLLDPDEEPIAVGAAAGFTGMHVTLGGRF